MISPLVAVCKFANGLAGGLLTVWLIDIGKVASLEHGSRAAWFFYVCVIA